MNMYSNGNYLIQNPGWHKEDAVWKTARVVQFLKDKDIDPLSIYDIGCGSGHVLAELRNVYPNALLYGYDIAPELQHFWKEHAEKNIYFFMQEFLYTNTSKCDIILLLDVLEHLQSPLEFLLKLHSKATHYLFHIPLDLSAFSVIRDYTLVNSRKKLGHVHYYTKNLALSLLEEAGFIVVEWRYSMAYSSSPQKTGKTTLSQIPRHLLGLLNKDLAVRILGGETLFVLCES